MKLRDKITVVTGATGGIGKATSKKILEGGKVVMVARNKDKLKKTLMN